MWVQPGSGRPAGRRHGGADQPATTTSLDPVTLHARAPDHLRSAAGFTAAAAPPAASLTLAPCGHPVAPIPPAVPQAQASFARNGDQEQVVEQVGALGTTAATNLVELVRETGT